MCKLNTAMAIQVLPSIPDRDKMVAVVDKVIENIQKKGLHYEVSAFETTIDGDLGTLMEILKESLEICIKEGAPSVMSYIKINHCPADGVLSIEEKTAKYKVGN